MSFSLTMQVLSLWQFLFLLLLACAVVAVVPSFIVLVYCYLVHGDVLFSYNMMRVLPVSCVFSCDSSKTLLNDTRCTLFNMMKDSMLVCYS